MDTIGRRRHSAHAGSSDAAPAIRNVAGHGERDWTAALRDACAYRNDAMIDRFCKLYAVSEGEASSLMVETMKWLWLCEFNRQCNPHPLILRIEPPLRIIDEMWHNMLLHTQDYAALCSRYFGAFAHHRPTSRADHAEHEQRRASMPAEEFAAAMRARSRPQYTLVYDLLGADTFRTWYVDYPARYPGEEIKALRR